MIVPALVLGLALQVDSIEVPMDARPTARRPVPAGTLVIPDPLGPAIGPYLRCRQDSLGVEVRANGQRQPPTVAIGADCAPQRARAAEHGDRLLRNRSRGTASERQAYVESVLARVDAFVGRHSAFAPASRPVAVADKPDDPLPSIDIPYQILPAFQVYANCVGDRFGADPRSRSADEGEIRDANADAVTACREVRAVQLAAALDRLSDYRPYGNSREAARAAVRMAFDRFDRDYLIEPDTAERTGLVGEPQSLSLPGEIAPAVSPYLACMVGDRHQRLLGVSTGDAARAAVDRLRSDCRPARDQAEADALRLLAASGVSPGRRAGMVAEVLVSIDRSRDNVAVRLDRVDARLTAAGNGTHAQDR
jgi:hypothetical protein